MATPSQDFPTVAIGTIPTFVGSAEANALWEAIQDYICRRAYELYEASGRQHGQDQKHWFQAEAEVLQPALHLRDAGTWIIATADLRGAAAEDLVIYINSRKLVVRAKCTAENANPNSASRCDAFLVAELDLEVEAKSASASFKDQQLTLMVKKRFPAKMASIQLAGPS